MKNLGKHLLTIRKTLETGMSFVKYSFVDSGSHGYRAT